jgi:hypothetical protein
MNLSKTAPRANPAPIARVAITSTITGQRAPYRMACCPANPSRRVEVGKTDYWQKFMCWVWMGVSRATFKTGVGRDWMRRYITEL